MTAAERALAVVLGGHLLFLPWAFGTMHVWSQTVSLVWAMAGLVFALVCPAINAMDLRHRSRRLIRFPVFWAGAFLLGYVWLQAVNPAWIVKANYSIWWLEARPHWTSLPTGIAAPFARSSAWRESTIYAAVWLAACAWWVAPLQRRTLRALFLALAVNGLLLAGLALLQRVTGATRIFWLYQPSNEYFASSFIYPNHAGAYFGLLTAVAAGLAWRYLESGDANLRTSAWIAAAAAGATMLGVLLSYSRMSVVLLIALFLVAAAFFVFRPAKNTWATYQRRLLGLLIVAMAGAAVLFFAFSTKRAHSRFSLETLSTTGNRAEARAATREMWAERWLFGWGAGSFRHVFPTFARQHSSLRYMPNGEQQIWEHAHDDLLEIPAELGVVGCLPILAAAVSAAGYLIRRRFWQNRLVLLVVIGTALTVAHAWVDFVFQCPAVLLTWAMLLVAACRWLEVDKTPTHVGRGLSTTCRA